MADQANQSDISVAFFVVRRTADGEGYISGALAIDDRGVPKEFRCTHPIRPSAAQRALYGGNLDSHINLELCGKPLVDALTVNPIAMLVETPSLLPLRELVTLPVLHVERLDEVLRAETSETNDTFGTRVAGKEERRLESEVSEFQPLAVDCHRGFEGDFDQTREALEKIFERVDLLEPFERITTALQVLAERDEKFK